LSSRCPLSRTFNVRKNHFQFIDFFWRESSKEFQVAFLGVGDCGLVPATRFRKDERVLPWNMHAAVIGAPFRIVISMPVLSKRKEILEKIKRCW